MGSTLRAEPIRWGSAAVQERGVIVESGGWPARFKLAGPRAVRCKLATRLNSAPKITLAARRGGMQTRPVARFIPQAAVRWYPMVAMGARRQPAPASGVFFARHRADCQHATRLPCCAPVREAGGGRAGRAGGRAGNEPGVRSEHATHGRNQAARCAALGWTARAWRTAVPVADHQPVPRQVRRAGADSKRVRGRAWQRSAIGPAARQRSGAAALAADPVGFLARHNPAKSQKFQFQHSTGLDPPAQAA